ncbi:MAG: NosD domain-containing protein, partial [Candidatus Natronoplasma sp.]
MTKKKMSLTLSLLAILLLIGPTVGDLDGNMNAQLDRTEHAVNDEYEEREPLHIEGNEDFANQSEENGWPGSGTEQDPYIIEGYRIDGGDNEAILIDEVDDYFIIRDNLLEGGQYGVHLILTYNGSIKGNIVEGVEMGIFLRASDYNIVENNVVTSNEEYGIRPSGSFNNTIRGNILEENSIGIAVINSANHTFEGNTAYNNENSGISFHRCYNNYLFDNRLSGHERGIELYASVNHVVKNNTIFENDIGFNIAVEPGSTTSRDNQIYNNNFIENDQQAINRGENYYFNETESMGNYYSDYEEKYPDAEKANGYWDTPYENDEGHGFIDEYPMVEPSIPYINIVHPEDGAVIEDTELTVNWTGRYRHEERLEYEIRLDDGEWIDVGEETEYDLEFSRSDPHSFEVRASNVNADLAGGTVDFSVDLEYDIRVEDFEVEPLEGFEPLEVNITAELENVGDVEGNISLYIDHETFKTWSLDTGENVSVDESYRFEEDGTYLIKLGDNSSEVTVRSPDPYELMVNIEGEGEVDIDPEQEEYEDGTEVKLTAVAEDGWEFVEWTGDVDTIEDTEE